LSAENWWEYINGYRKAGDALLSSSNVLGSGRKEYELIYPMVFSYRHYIELQLKEIILNAREFLDVNEEFPKGHYLEELWAMCRELLQKMDKTLDPRFTASDGYKDILNAYKDLESDLKIFWEIDPNSEYFRYPVDGKGKPIVAALQSVDFKNLEKLIGRIDQELGGIASGVYTILSEKYDSMKRGG